MDIKLSERLNPAPNPYSSSRSLFNGLWGLTEIIGCPAAPLHQALGCPTREIDAQTAALFYEGILHENDLKSRIRDLGYLIFDYPSRPSGIFAQDVPVVGHPDGNLMGEEILETKSIDGQPSSEEFIASHPQYIKQVMGYMRLTGLETARIIAKSRSTGWILDDIVIPYDPVIIEPAWKNIQHIEKLLSQGVASCVGGWAPQCSGDYLTRLFCPFSSVHCQVSEGQATAEIDKVLLEYATLKPTYDQASMLISQMREQVKGLMKESGLTRVKGQNGASASLYNHSSTSTDYKLAEEILDPVTYHRIFTKNSTQTVRITLPKDSNSEEST